MLRGNGKSSVENNSSHLEVPNEKYDSKLLYSPIWSDVLLQNLKNISPSIFFFASMKSRIHMLSSSMDTILIILEFPSIKVSCCISDIPSVLSVRLYLSSAWIIAQRLIWFGLRICCDTSNIHLDSLLSMLSCKAEGSKSFPIPLKILSCTHHSDTKSRRQKKLRFMQLCNSILL